MNLCDEGVFMYREYKPNVLVPKTNDQLFSQMKLHIIGTSTHYLSKNKQGQLSFFVKDGMLRTFYKPNCIELVNEYEDQSGGLSRKGLINMLNHLEEALKKRKTILYADLFVDYEADENGELAYLELIIRTQEHFASIL